MEKHPQRDEHADAIAHSDITAGTPATNPVARDPAPPEVALPDDEAFLRRVASEIRGFGPCEYIEAGRLLAEAKKRVSADEWLFWIENKFGWTEDQASKLMDVNEEFLGLPLITGEYSDQYSDPKVRLFFELSMTSDAEPPTSDDPYHAFKDKHRKAEMALRNGVELSLGWRPLQKITATQL